MLSKLATPSQNSGYNVEDLSTFLANSEFRKLYNRMLSTAKKYNHVSACNWFLNECLSANIVPKTFKISNQPHLKNDQFSARWTEASKAASIGWMKIALENDINKEKELLEDVTSKCNVLRFLAPNERISEDLKQKLGIKGRQFRMEAMNEKKKKFEKLRESLNVTLASDDDQQLDAHKPKTKRKWIKKSKFQRLQRRKKKEKVSVVFNYSRING